MRWAALAMLMMGCTSGGLLPCVAGAERGADGVSCVGGVDTYVPIPTGDTGIPPDTDTDTDPTADTAGETGDTGKTGDTSGSTDTSTDTSS